MTIKLYDNDAYQTKCEAKVLSCEKKDDHHFLITLDQTIFFPEEGGQTPDKGTINQYSVTDVQIKDEIITHKISVPEGEAPFKAGDSVSLQLESLFSHNYNLFNWWFSKVWGKL